MSTYTVKPGDSLSIIARDVLGDMSLWPEIARINNITNVNVIYPGQVLQLPSTSTNSATDTGTQAKAGFGWLGSLLMLLIVGGALYEATKEKKKKNA